MAVQLYSENVKWIFENDRYRTACILQAEVVKLHVENAEAPLFLKSHT